MNRLIKIRTGLRIQSALALAAFFAIAGSLLSALPASAGENRKWLNDAEKQQLAMEGDAAAGLPVFKSKEERAQYMMELYKKDPKKFNEIMKKRQLYNLEHNPLTAQNFKERRDWLAQNPKVAAEMERERQELERNPKKKITHTYQWFGKNNPKAKGRYGFVRVNQKEN